MADGPEDAFARFYAQKIHEGTSIRLVSCLRHMVGIGLESDGGVEMSIPDEGDREFLVFCGRHPDPDSSVPHDRRLANFRKLVKRRRIKEVGFAAYPEEMPDDGFGYAIVLKAKEDKVELLYRLWEESRQSAR
jgi:hypothetical protein